MNKYDIVYIVMTVCVLFGFVALNVKIDVEVKYLRETLEEQVKFNSTVAEAIELLSLTVRETQGW
jgi:hypothetical protein